jgi:hypothetical protein
MPTYCVFGGVLDSEVAFDGLPVAAVAGQATWRFRVASASSALESTVLVGREEVSAELTTTLSRAADSTVVLHYSAYGLGEFRISPDGREIVWVPGAEPWLEALRWVLFGRVMATALYVGGVLCLHGSAVCLNGEGICFLAPKHHGKSTLAAAMVAAGAQLATDDVLPIDVGPPIRLRPGVPVLRLRSDSERAVSLAGAGQTRVPADVGKARIDLSAEGDLVSTPQALSAIYILAPGREEPEPTRAAMRTRLATAPALSMVMRHASLAPLLSPGEARPLFASAVAIVSNVPVYMLRSIRSLPRLPEVVAELQAWHGRDQSPLHSDILVSAG